MGGGACRLFALPSSIYNLQVILVSSRSSNPFEYSGFINVNEKFDTNLYYVFFPSIDGNKTAPTILWLNGGPGESSIGTGLFELFGPYKVNEDLELVKNPYTWNLHYNLLFVGKSLFYNYTNPNISNLDQPAGTGFSYTQPEGYMHYAKDSSEQLYIFLQKWFSMYPEFSTNDLYVGGESYGGCWVPSIVHTMIAHGLEELPCKLKGMLLLDAFTDPISIYHELSNIAYYFGLLDTATYKIFQGYQEKLVQYTVDGNYSFSADMFNHMIYEFEEVTGGVTEMNILKDITDYDFYLTDKYVNLESTRKLMHTGNHVFNHSSGIVYNNFRDDLSRSVIDYVVEGLDQEGLKVLFLTGQLDWYCGVAGQERTVQNMKWSGQEEFSKLKNKYWKIDDNEYIDTVALTRNFGNLYFAVVRRAGHISPFDTPKVDLDLISKFIDGTGDF